MCVSGGLQYAKVTKKVIIYIINKCVLEKKIKERTGTDLKDRGIIYAPVTDRKAGSFLENFLYNLTIEIILIFYNFQEIPWKIVMME